MAAKCEKKFQIKKATFSLLTLFSCVCGYAVAIPRLRLEELVSDSDVVVVGQIATARDTGKAEIRLEERIVPTDTFSADVTVIRQLKGECPSQITVTYSVPSGRTMGYRTVGTGIRLLFLRHSSDGLIPTDPYYPPLPASAAQPGASGSDPVANVIGELGAVLASETESPAVKQQVLDVAYAIPPNEPFTASLRLALDTSDLDLRYRVMANLVRRHDHNILPRVTELLLETNFPAQYRRMFEFVIGTSVSEPAAVRF
jgi:hypothetical protein